VRLLGTCQLTRTAESGVEMSLFTHTERSFAQAGMRAEGREDFSALPELFVHELSIASDANVEIVPP